MFQKLVSMNFSGELNFLKIFEITLAAFKPYIIFFIKRTVWQSLIEKIKVRNFLELYISNNKVVKRLVIVINNDTKNEKQR